MYEFNTELFKKCVWYYAKRQSVVTPTTWEEIIGRSTNSQWIPGDHFMADVVNPDYLSNVKSLKRNSLNLTNKPYPLFNVGHLLVTIEILLMKNWVKILFKFLLIKEMKVLNNFLVPT